MTNRSLRAALGLALVVAATAAAPAASEPRAATDQRAPAAQGTAEASQQPSLRLFRAWLAAFNSGDRARYAKFLKRNFPTWAPLIDRDLGLREFTGGFDLRKVGRVSATRVSGWVEERDSDQFVSFTMCGVGGEASEDPRAGPRPHPSAGGLSHPAPDGR